MVPGAVLGGRFELKPWAGEGGLGTVFEARDLASGELVAVKVLHRLHDTRAGRFEREAALLAELRHPGIVRYAAHGLAPSGVPFLAMEWLSGEDLGRRLRRAPLTLEETLTLI